VHESRQRRQQSQNVLRGVLFGGEQQRAQQTEAEALELQVPVAELVQNGGDEARKEVAQNETRAETRARCAVDQKRWTNR
jgi:hypothetical protein